MAVVKLTFDGSLNTAKQDAAFHQKSYFPIQNGYLVPNTTGLNPVFG